MLDVPLNMLLPFYYLDCGSIPLHMYAIGLMDGDNPRDSWVLFERFFQREKENDGPVLLPHQNSYKTIPKRHTIPVSNQSLHDYNRGYHA